MSVLERIKNLLKDAQTELLESCEYCTEYQQENPLRDACKSLSDCQPIKLGMEISELLKGKELDSLLCLAAIGERARWIDGKPPAFGAEERKWIIFEHLTPFTRATVYDTAAWMGKYYSDEKVKLARRWALLPLPEPPEGVQNA